MRYFIGALLVGIIGLYVFNTQFKYQHGLVDFDEKSWSDERPERRILFIGNSNTYLHAMPQMVRRMADSANVPERYAVTMYARPSAWLKQHWQEAEFQELMQQPWDDVVIQANAGEPLKPEWKRDFMHYGIAIAQAAKKQGARVVLYPQWRYMKGISYYQGHPDLPDLMYKLIQEGHEELAQRTGAKIVNVGRATMRLRQTYPDFPFYEPDGNHGTTLAYHMTALMFFQHFSGKSADTVTYKADDVPAKYDRILKTIVRYER